MGFGNISYLSKVCKLQWHVLPPLNVIPFFQLIALFHASDNYMYGKNKNSNFLFFSFSLYLARTSVHWGGLVVATLAEDGFATLSDASSRNTGRKGPEVLRPLIRTGSYLHFLFESQYSLLCVWQDKLSLTGVNSKIGRKKCFIETIWLIKRVQSLCWCTVKKMTVHHSRVQV